MNTDFAQRTRWGRTRWGGSTALLLSTSTAVGLVIASGVGGLFAWLGGLEQPLLGFTVLTITTLPVATTLSWALIVDRATVTGMTRSPEHSIESTWYEKAASGAFGDVLVITALGSAGFAFLRVEAPVTWILFAMAVLTILDFAARYLWLRKAAL